MSTMIENWRAVLTTQNVPEGATVDPVSKWLLITRASVFPMTLTSGAIGGLLAVSAREPQPANWTYFALAMLGLVLAHAANNMINDWFDLQGGVDSEDYVRGQYAPHPILSGMISKGGLVAAIALVNLADLAILVYLADARGWPVALFALLGLFISVFYVAPPVKLKHHGFGEPGVAVVWGPLMICGTYFVTTGTLPAWVFVASVPYAILVTTVLLGKHVDKHDADAAKGIRTLPVILGADRSLFLIQGLIALYFALVAFLVLTGTLGVWVLLTFLALPRAVQVWKVMSQPRPAEKPANYPIWPLWFVAWAFLVTRLAGGLFVLGLVLNAIWPVFV
jgi:1,4-dihydroxy-2-naphthoate octaprenyltransferase